MRVFVTGGSGFVGGHFIQVARAAGHEVHAMARSSESARRVRAFGATPVDCSLDDVGPAHLAGVDAVVHAAAHVAEWGTRDEFWAGNVTGTTRMLEAARAAGVRRFVHVGTEAAVFSGSDLVDIDEAHPYPARHRYLYSETKADAERRVLAAASASFETLSIRPRLVWGPRDATVLPVIVRMAREGRFAWIGGGAKKTSATHVRNLAHALVLALDHGRSGQAYFVADSEVQTIRELMTALARTQGVELPSRSLPTSVARGLARVVEGAYRLARKKSTPPLTRFAIDMMSSEITVNTKKAARELGYRPVVSLEEGLLELARERDQSQPSPQVMMKERVEPTMSS
ncbi:MAG: NAD-dependent epimerase/dehydratase family protein [Polyangiaceae bacterium]